MHLWADAGFAYHVLTIQLSIMALPMMTLRTLQLLGPQPSWRLQWCFCHTSCPGFASARSGEEHPDLNDSLMSVHPGDGWWSMFVLITRLVYWTRWSSTLALRPFTYDSLWWLNKFAMEVRHLSYICDFSCLYMYCCDFCLKAKCTQMDFASYLVVQACLTYADSHTSYILVLLGFPNDFMNAQVDASNPELFA